MEEGICDTDLPYCFGVFAVITQKEMRSRCGDATALSEQITGRLIAPPAQ